MHRSPTTLSTAYFEEKYRRDIDPWGFRSSVYEHNKYQATVGALGRPRFQAGLEIGCSIGILTAMLARRCETLLAIDTSQTAVAEARRFCKSASNVTFAVNTLPQEYPAGTFDLIVLSEVLYYFSFQDLEDVAVRCAEAIHPRGEIILCHWLGETDYPLTGHQASDLFATAIHETLPVRTVLQNDGYRLERLSSPNKRDATPAK